MPTDVILPQLGESVAEGVIMRWLKRPGDKVIEQEPLVEIATDKVNVELPAPASGVVTELRAQEGETVPVEQVIAVIGEPDQATLGPASEHAAQQAAEAAVPGPTVPVTMADEIQGRQRSLADAGAIRMVADPSAAGAGAQPGAGDGTPRRHYSPLVRRIADENGLDLDHLVSSGQLLGTGEGGRVTKADVLGYVSRSTGVRGSIPSLAPPPTTPARAPAPPVVPATPPTVTAAAPAPAAPPAAAPASTESADDIVVPFAGIRKMIADHLVRSAFSAPHVTTVAQADVTRMVAFRAANKDSWEREHGVRLTYTPFFVRATADALLAFPMVNSQISGDQIVAHKYVHMGVAVSLGEGGLIVPVIRDAHKKDLVTIARELEDIARRARAGQLSPADVQAGTFSITNPGIFGAIISTPIINGPQSAILGVEAIQKQLVVRDDDSLAVRSMMYLCLSYDHRVVDGETAIRFLQHIRKTLEEFRFLR